MMPIHSQILSIDHEYRQTPWLHSSLNEFELKLSDDTSNIAGLTPRNKTPDLYAVQVSNQVALFSHKHWTWEQQSLAIEWYYRNQDTFHHAKFQDKWYKGARITPRASPVTTSSFEQTSDDTNEEDNIERGEPKGESHIWTWSSWSRNYYRSRVKQRARHLMRSLYISNSRRKHIRGGNPFCEDESDIKSVQDMTQISDFCLRKKEILWREQSILDSGKLKHRCYAPSLLRWCWTVRLDDDGDGNIDGENDSVVLDEDQHYAALEVEEDLAWDPVEPVEASNEIPWGAEREHRGGW